MISTTQTTVLVIWDWNDGVDNEEEEVRWEEIDKWLKSCPKFAYTKVHDSCEI